MDITTLRKAAELLNMKEDIQRGKRHIDGLIKDIDFSQEHGRAAHSGEGVGHLFKKLTNGEQKTLAQVMRGMILQKEAEIDKQIAELGDPPAATVTSWSKFTATGDNGGPEVVVPQKIFLP